MAQYLEQLGKDLLPKSVEADFVQWCIWEQAQPALIKLMQDTGLAALSKSLQAAKSLSGLLSASAAAAEALRRDYKTDALRGLFAARGAAFEFLNLLKEATETEPDAEEVAFFAVRVCGWAGWAQTNFSRPDDKQAAENEARAQQGQKLEALMGASSGV